MSVVDFSVASLGSGLYRPPGIRPSIPNMPLMPERFWDYEITDKLGRVCEEATQQLSISE